MLDKPAGLKVHAGPGGGASVEDWFPQLSRRSTGPWLAHRLDADTAGCLVVALRLAALHEAQACFAEGRAGKTYWAVVQGTPAEASGCITISLSKRTDSALGWRMVADADGMPSRTDYVVLGHSGDLTWLELRPQTGRSHQLRVHCASLGCPILGDPLYGLAGGGLQLLARSIHLPLAPPVIATARPPPHMEDKLVACGFSSGR